MPERTSPPPDLDRLRWQCRRGMLELDEMLLDYLDRSFVAAPADVQAAFRRLLQIEDPVLNEWLLLGEPPGVPELSDIVARVRSG